VPEIVGSEVLTGAARERAFAAPVAMTAASTAPAASATLARAVQRRPEVLPLGSMERLLRVIWNAVVPLYAVDRRGTRKSRKPAHVLTRAE
jgi:hypothetical protein